MSSLDLADVAAGSSPERRSSLASTPKEDVSGPSPTAVLDHSSRLLQQISIDLHAYELKTKTFFRSLIAAKQRKDPGGPAVESAGKVVDDAEQEEDSNPTDSDVGSRGRDGGDESLSDDSQNLRGFESEDAAAAGGSHHQLRNSRSSSVATNDDDSSSNSDVFHAYRNQRIEMILQGKGVASAYDTTGAASSDGEAGMQRGRSRSVDSRRTQQQQQRGSALRSSGTGKRAVTGEASAVAEPSGGLHVSSSKDAQLVRELEEALQRGGNASSSAIASGSPARRGEVSATNLLASSPLPAHFETLDRQRLAAVVRTAKGDTNRAVALATKYSGLRDRLGVAHTSAEDVSVFSQSKAVWILSGEGVTKDRSHLVYVAVRLLPRMAQTNESYKKQYAVGLIRFVILLLENERFERDGVSGEKSGGVGGAGVALKISGSGGVSGQAATGALTRDTSQPVDDSNDQQPQQPLTIAQGSAQARHQTPPKRTARGKRHRARDEVRDEDAFTFLLDVSGCESSMLSSLSTVLSQGDELLSQSYPIHIARVVVYLGRTVLCQTISTGPVVHADPAPASTSVAPPVAVPATPPVPPTQAKSEKSGPVSLFASIFKKKAAAANGPASSGASPPPGKVAPTTPEGGSMTTKMWLSVMVSTWKLRFLQHTVRSRTTFTDNAESVINVAAFRAAIDSELQSQVLTPTAAAVAT